MSLMVKDVMTLKVMTLKLNEQLSLADDVMNLSRIRHLPVLDDEGANVVGIVSQRDLFRGALAQAVGYTQNARRKLLNKLKVKDVMSPSVMTTTPDTPMSEAAHMLIEHKNRMSAGARGRPSRGHSDGGRLRGSIRQKWGKRVGPGFARAKRMIRKL